MKCKYCGLKSESEFCSSEHKENSIAFNVLESITDRFAFVFGATVYPWKVELTANSYDILKNRPGTKWSSESKVYILHKLIYEKDGHEYLVCWENLNIPIVIHARISDTVAAVDNIKLDDLNRPNIEEEYQEDWNSFDWDKELL